MSRPRGEFPYGAEKEVKEYGHDVIVDVKFFRHGEKAGEELAPAGYEQAREKGAALQPAGHAIKGYHSESIRTKQMIEAVIAAINADPRIKEYRPKETPLLSFAQHFSAEFVNRWREIAKEQGDDAATQMYIDHGKERPDQNTISPYEMASHVAKLINHYIKMSSKLYSGSRIDLLNATHATVPEPFLAEMFREEIERDPINPEGKTLVEKMGGGFKTAEEFRIMISRADKDTYIANIFFRDKVWPLKREKLKELVDFYDEKETEETAEAEELAPEMPPKS